MSDRTDGCATTPGITGRESAQRSAAELGSAVLEFLAAGRCEDLAALFAQDGEWELAYRLDGLRDDQLVVRTRRTIGKFHAVIRANIDSVTFTDVQAHSVTPDLAFLEFSSTAVTVKGDAYGNRYVAKAQARGGELIRWLEFFDPRPAELIRRDFAESVARR